MKMRCVSLLNDIVLQSLEYKKLIESKRTRKITIGETLEEILIIGIKTLEKNKEKEAK